MVEHNKTKRERNIRAKLMAAIAMLLVSSIMMVSTTYAWFTLSTAPEVSGITTTIASNGNLEIALSPADGVGANVGNATTALVDPALKNLTWGNLVDMGFANNTYGLDKLTLAPAQLAMNGNATDGYTLGSNVLATPVYGADGRISSLAAEAFIASKAADGKYSVTSDFTYGVRAVGTASQLSDQEKALRTAVNAISNNADAAIAAIRDSLQNNGDALAAMLVNHAQGGDEAYNYAKYVPSVLELVDGLDASIGYINEAIRAILSAATVTLQDGVEENKKDAQGNDVMGADGQPEKVVKNYFTTAYNLVNGKNEAGTDYANTVDQLLAMDNLGFTVPEQVDDLIAARDKIDKIINGDPDVADDTGTKGAAEALEGKLDYDGDGTYDEDDYETTEDITLPKATILWGDVAPVLNDLMNTEVYTADEATEKGDATLAGKYKADIKINGYTLDYVKAQLKGDKQTAVDFAMSLTNDTQIMLGADSGVYYDIAEITGNITAMVKGVKVEAMGVSVPLNNVTIKTTVASTTTHPMLPVAKAYIESNSTGDNAPFKPAAAATGSVAIDTNYGYVIDLMVRTNAANSNLLLQTDPEQRVYGDSTNSATQGKGTTIVFTAEGSADAAAVTNLCKSICIAFFDPTTNAVMGLAKVTDVATPDPVGKVDATTGAAVNDADGNQIMVYTITGYLELCEIATANGHFVAGAVQTGDDASVLCPLVQNQAKAISALVYLDGNNVTSADVLADRGVTGALNLQFASSAELKPMMNSDLYAGEGGNQNGSQNNAQDPSEGQ